MAKVLRDYQRAGVDLLTKAERCLLAFDTGDGKTFTCVSFIKERQIEDFLIVCPLAVVGQWYLELITEAGIHATVLKGSQAPLRLAPGPYIVHHDILRHWYGALAGNRQLMIIDESQLMGNPKSKRAKCTMALAAKSHYLVGLSATPFRTYPRQLWPLLHMIDPKAWKSAWAFYSRYCDLKKGRFGITYDGATNMGELKAKLKDVMITHKNKQQFQRIDLWHYSDHIDVVHNQLKLLETLTAAALYTQMSQMQQVNFEKKAAPVMDWIKEYSKEEPLIVFYWHHAVGDYIRLYTGCPLYDGRTSIEERQKIRSRQFPVLAMNLQSGGVGIDGLQNMYATAAFVEFGYSPADIKQAIGRIARNGQKKPVKIYFHGALGTSDELFLGRMKSRFQLLSTVFGTLGEDFMGDDLLKGSEESC